MTNSISLFNAAVAGYTNDALINECMKLGLKLGYLFEPKACTEQTLDWLKSQKADFNSTFYKTWEDIVSKSRFKLLIDQLLHYASTYGTNFSGEAYIPNDGDTPDFDITNYKVIKAITIEELCTKCIELSKSGINLSDEVVEFCGETIYSVYHKTSKDPKTLISDITNRELKTKLYDLFSISPIDEFELLRYISNKQTGSAMIIQNSDTIMDIKRSLAKFDFTSLTTEQIENLSKVFLRYKNWLLAFKNTKNAPILNKMRRLAKKNHTPLKQGFWETVLSTKPSLKVVKSHLVELTPFKKIQLYMACKERMLGSKYRSFLIRNQKFYYKSNNITPDEYLVGLMYLLKMSLFTSRKVKLPKNFRLACPSSEKSFIGNYPLGTSYHFHDNDAFMGIYWKGAWGTRDFDLHYFNSKGVHIGWNSGFTTSDNGIVFSGDMTFANPEATELMYMKKGCPEGFLTCSRFSGNMGSRFDIILGSQPIDQMRKNYMVDPNNVHLRVKCTSESREQVCGYVKDNEFTLMSFRTGNKSVPGNPELVHILADKSKCFLYLDEIVRVVDEDYEGDDYIDLSGQLDKDSIINFLLGK